MLETFFKIISLNILSDPFSFLFFILDPYDLNVDVFNVVPEVSEIVVISFYSFLLSSASQQLFLPLYFQLTYPFFCLNYSTTDSFLSMFHFRYCVVHHCLFSSSSRFLLNISSIISIHDSILLQDLGPSLLSLLSTLFQTGCLFPFCLSGIVGFYLDPLPAT